VLARFDALVLWLGAPTSAGIATHGEGWSPEEDGAWPPPRDAQPRMSRFGRNPRSIIQTSAADRLSNIGCQNKDR
jgi:hypothetical protein